MVVRLVKVEKFGCICYNIPIELIFEMNGRTL